MRSGRHERREAPLEFVAKNVVEFIKMPNQPSGRAVEISLLSHQSFFEEPHYIQLSAISIMACHRWPAMLKKRCRFETHIILSERALLPVMKSGVAFDS